MVLRYLPDTTCWESQFITLGICLMVMFAGVFIIQATGRKKTGYTQARSKAFLPDL
jgi:hypothetical protein